MKLRHICYFIFAVILLAALALGFALWQAQQYSATTLLIRQPVLFTLPPGSGQRALSEKLYQEHIINSPMRLRWLLRLQPQLARVKAGTYQFTPAMRVADMLQLLSSGKEAQFPLRIAPGSRLSDVLAELRRAPYLKHELKDDDYATLAKALAIDVKQLEGNFAPDTWLYTAGSSDVALLRRAHRQMQQQLTQLWATRDKDLPYRSPYQLLIMASIIEKETGMAEERALVASVFINRLRKGMRLQTDPTVIYGMGDKYQGNISRKDLQTPSAYNTYLISGLPPTAIAMPGLPALQAAARPAQSDYFYFVANGKGGHTFSRNLAEHNKAVQLYLNQLRAK